jgi:hypothetical protein
VKETKLSPASEQGETHKLGDGNEQQSHGEQSAEYFAATTQQVRLRGQDGGGANGIERHITCSDGPVQNCSPSFGPNQHNRTASIVAVSEFLPRITAGDIGNSSQPIRA